MRKSINKRYDTLIKIIIESGKIALQNFHPGEKSDYNIKSDSSELTKADLEVNEFLIRNLSKFYPQIPVISEENNIEQNAAAILCKEVFIIDPLDGTSSFVKGSPEFTINISLKSDKDLTLGAIYSPMQDILYYADNECGVYKISNASSDAKIQKLQKTDLENKSELNVIATRREDEFAEIKKMLFASDKKINYINMASSIKFCLLCDGSADAYYRAARIKIWDVAAGFAIVRLFGFKVTDHYENDLFKIIFEQSYLKNLPQNQFRIEPFIVKM